MTYRVHPDTAWVHDPNTDSIQAMALPTGEPMSIGGTGCVIFLDVVDGRDPVAEALARWDAPEAEVRVGVEQFLTSLLDAGILIEVEAAPRRASGFAPPTVEPATRSDDVPSSPDIEEIEETRDYRLVFVCTANICRSAFADVRLNARGLPGLDISSAGTHALVGQQMDPPMAAHLTNPEDGQRHRARQLTRAIVDDADLIVAMSERHRDFILEEWPHAAKKTFLIGHVARELDRLPATATRDDIAPHLWAHRKLRPDDSIRDPYRRGDQVALATARKIDSHLDRLGEVMGRILTGERA